MKKNNVKLFSLALVFGVSLSAFAQTKEERAEIVKHYDLEKNADFNKQLAERNKQNYERALQLAAERGWPLKKDKGEYTATLVGVTANDEPIYIQPYNAGAAVTARANLVNTGGGLGYDLNGQNIVFGLWEPGRVRTSHLDLAGSVTVMDGATFNGNDSDNGHATHVTGTMISNGDFNAAGRGLAYEATVLAHDAFNDTSEASQRADEGLLLSNHSYGWDPERLARLEEGCIYK